MKDKLIAWQNKDITCKFLAEQFPKKSFSAYGVDLPEIEACLPTNLPEIEANELRMDQLFLRNSSFRPLHFAAKAVRTHRLSREGICPFAAGD